MSTSVDPLAALRAHREPVLQLLARVLWADQRMSPRQVQAVTAACELLGESEAARLITGRPESASQPFGIPEAVGPLSVAAAAWVAAIDGRTHTAELVLLDALAEELQLDAAVAARMHVIGLGRATLARSTEPADLEQVLRDAQSWLDGQQHAA